MLKVPSSLLRATARDDSLPHAPTRPGTDAEAPLASPGALLMRTAVDPASGGAGGAAEAGRAEGAGASRTSAQGAGRVTPAEEHVALWLRLIIWVVAIPLGAGIVFGAAELLGALSSKQLLDTFLDSGLDRFGAVARLLPLWALASAAFVHFSVMAIGRWRGRRRRSREARADSGSRQPREEREPVRAGS